MTEAQREWFSAACISLSGRSTNVQQALASKGAGFFAMALVLTARNFGLDSHLMDGFDQNGIRGVFNLPNNCRVTKCLAV